jgi:DNA primase large subunit
MTSRIDVKRRADINHKKRQFVAPTYAQLPYKHRLNFYSLPPTADITLEEFEEWAIHRLKGTIAPGVTTG